MARPARHQWRRYLDESLWFDPGEAKDPIVVTKLERAIQEIQALVPQGTEFILIDEAISTPDAFPQRQSHPFLERNGEPWGNPPDDETAIKHLEQMRQSGSRFIVFLWPAFWWFEFYSEFHRLTSDQHSTVSLRTTRCDIL